MEFEWKNYLELAKSLSDPQNHIQNDEATYRTIVSRAYYAAFHSAVEFGKKHGYVNMGGTDHQGIQKFYRDQKFLPEQEETKNDISTQLSRLRDRRVQADYKKEPISKYPKTYADNSVGIAEKIISCIDALENGK